MSCSIPCTGGGEGAAKTKTIPFLKGELAGGLRSPIGIVGGVGVGADSEGLVEALMAFSLCLGWTVVCVIFDERPSRLPGLIAIENLDGIPAV